MTTFRRFDTMLDWPPTARTGVGRGIGMGSPTCFFTSDPPIGTRCSGAGASIAPMGAASSAPSPALPLGRFPRASQRPAYSVQPVPLSVVFGTGDECEFFDAANEVCLGCGELIMRCRCLGGDGLLPSPQ